MRSFSFEFPIDQSNTVLGFSSLIREWIIGSRHTKFDKEQLVDLGRIDHWSSPVEIESEKIESIRPKEQKKELIAIKYTKIENDNIEWRTLIVFSETESSKWVSIQIDCDLHNPSNHLPTAKKPVLVRLILEKLGGGLDGEITVSNKPLILRESDMDLAINCINGDTNAHLPIIYVSAKFIEGYIVDPYELSKRLSGMAHVVVEPNRFFSSRIKEIVSFKNVYGGTIGIYWPDGNSRSSFFINENHETPEDIINAIFYNIQSALNNRRPLYYCTWSYVKDIYAQKLIEDMKNAKSDNIDEWIEVFSDQLKTKENELQLAEKDINRLKAEIRKYEARNYADAGIILSTGQEQDLYPGELINILMDSIHESISRAAKNSRREHILTGFFEANRRNIENNNMKDQIKSILRGYTNMDSKTRKSLEVMGFTISEDGSHIKIIFQNDERYIFVLPKSGSDHRGGLNAANDIARLLF